MAPTVRIGFVGVGNMGQCAHLRNYVGISGVEVAAIAEPRSKLAHAVATRYGVPAVYADADSMVTAERLDGLVAIQPFDHHGSVVLPLYRHGLPILTEKPLASSVSVGQAMVEALRAGGSWHMVAYHKRCDPATEVAVQEIQRLKATGELGALRFVRVTMPEGDWIAGGFNDLIRTDEAPPQAPQDPTDPSMTDAEFAEYVRFVNYYVHQVNLLRFLLGESYELSYVDQGGILLVARSAGGATGTIEMSPYRTTIDWQESALVAFERGTVKLDLPAPLALNRPGAVEVFRDPGGQPPETVRPSLPFEHAMRRQAEAYVAAIRGERRPPCEALEALDDLNVAKRYIELRRQGAA